MATTQKKPAKKPAAATAVKPDTAPVEGISSDAVPTGNPAAASTPIPPADAAPAAAAPPPPDAAEVAAGEATEVMDFNIFTAPVFLAAATHLDICADRDSFWRAGRRWTREPQRVAIADLTEAQIAALRAEPVLTVVGVAE